MNIIYVYNLIIHFLYVIYHLIFQNLHLLNVQKYILERKVSMRQNHQLDLPYKNESNQYKDLLKQFQAEPDCPNRFCFCNGFYGSQKDEDQIFNLLKLCLLPDVEEDTELILCDVSWNGLFAGKAFLRFQQYFPNIKLHIILPSLQDDIALQLIRDYQRLCSHADAEIRL